MFFRDISKPIPPIYNLLVAMLWRHPQWVDDLDNIKVVHYCVAGSKPWRYSGKEENMDRADIKMLVERWWDIYNDEALDFTTDVRPASESSKLASTLAEAEVVVQYISASSAA
ncbi:UNVERIFIED_CONTAM: Galactinol synthase 2 [Sesamum radiatum]